MNHSSPLPHSPVLQRKTRLFLMLLLGMLLLPSVAVRGKSLSSDLPFTAIAAPPPGKYLLVELWVEVDGTGVLPQVCVDFPDDKFTPRTSLRSPFVHDLPGLVGSDWGFVGGGESRTGAAGCGVASGLSLLPVLPYQTTLALGTGTADVSGEQQHAVPVELVAVAADGTLAVDIDGTRVILATDEHWIHTATAELRTESFDGEYRITSSIHNLGWQNRTRIEPSTQVLWLPVFSGEF